MGTQQSNFGQKESQRKVQSPLTVHDTFSYGLNSNNCPLTFVQDKQLKGFFVNQKKSKNNVALSKLAKLDGISNLAVMLLNNINLMDIHEKNGALAQSWFLCEALKILLYMSITKLEHDFQGLEPAPA